MENELVLVNPWALFQTDLRRGVTFVVKLCSQAVDRLPSCGSNRNG